MAQTALIAIKCTKPRRRNALQRGSLYAGTAEKPYFMRFSGIEKVHRNSIRITVDFFYARKPLEIKTFAVFEHKRTPLQSNYAVGFRAFCAD